MTTPVQLTGIPPLHLASRAKQEYAGACPFCGGDHRSDRFRVWPAQNRYWCRQCNASGWLDALAGDRPQPSLPPQPKRAPQRATPSANPAHVARYRELYAAVALWAYTKLWEAHNPEPLDYLRQRGLADTTIGAALLGITLRDPDALPDFLRREHPELLAYAEAAGVLTRSNGVLQAHPNLRGAILLPYMADGQIVDLRTRSFPGKGYRSLPGGYSERGATAPFGWDSLDGSDTVIITEGELKALAVNQAYRADHLSAPAIAHPGLSYWRPEWGAQLRARGVTTVILAYDSQPRPTKDGHTQLAPEEIYSIRHGLRMAEDGLQVRVLRLPLAADADKADLDAFLLTHRPIELERLLSAAPSLADYHASLPRTLLRTAKLPEACAYPRHRARPRPIAAAPMLDAPAATTLAEARDSIPQQVHDHAAAGSGFLVLAHPPGVGKGHGTTAGLKLWLREDPEAGRIGWTAPRKDQLHDQQGLNLIALHGRNPGNCQRHREASTLSAKGYGVHETLCLRRCPFVSHCAYLRQFREENDHFAPQPMLQALGWWEQNGIMVLDEFDPAQLTRIVTLDSRDLAAMSAGANESSAQAILRWLSGLLIDSGGRALRGSTLLSALDAAASREGQPFAATLRRAIAALPPAEDQAMLPGLPTGATLADYQALPPAHLPTLLNQLDHEARILLMGRTFTSRLELRDGTLTMLLRHEQLIAQLARPEQPKVLLDATLTPGLLEAIFPHTPIQTVQPHIPIPGTVRQVIRSDWAKTTLRGDRTTAWHDAVAAQIRPGRRTLVVCTLDCEDELRQALQARGHTGVELGHFGGLRGSNQYAGADVIVAQAYHPNLEGILREGRALFADDRTPLDERMIIAERTLRATDGTSWAVEVTTFADPRLAALLERRREAELTQCALRGRPFDHPESQITLMFSMPLPGLPPTTISAPEPGPTSGGGRRQASIQQLIAAGQQLIAAGQQRITVDQLAKAAEVSVVTVRVHWQTVADALDMQTTQETMTTPGRRSYQRAVLTISGTPDSAAPTGKSTDQADNKDLITSLICAPEPVSAMIATDSASDGAVSMRESGASVSDPGHRRSDDRYFPPPAQGGGPPPLPLLLLSGADAPLGSGVGVARIHGGPPPPCSVPRGFATFGAVASSERIYVTIAPISTLVSRSPKAGMAEPGRWPPWTIASVIAASSLRLRNCWLLIAGPIPPEPASPWHEVQVEVNSRSPRASTACASPRSICTGTGAVRATPAAEISSQCWRNATTEVIWSGSRVLPQGAIIVPGTPSVIVRARVSASLALSSGVFRATPRDDPPPLTPWQAVQFSAKIVNPALHVAPSGPRALMTSIWPGSTAGAARVAGISPRCAASSRTCGQST
nr:hypothetical protein [Oscillochloris sp. ZM17-4]